MNFTQDEKQRVFTAYRDVFSGQNSKVRSNKVIRGILVRHQEDTGIDISDKEMTRLIHLLNFLLEGKIFESTACAMKMFPDVFKPTASRVKAKEASEASASKKESEMLEEVEKINETEQNLKAEQVEQSLQNSFKAPCESNSKARLLSNIGLVSGQRPVKGLSLFPTYLPYETQHLLLGAVQELLEQCCFDFASKWLPEERQKCGWETSNAVELTTWTQVLPDLERDLPSGAVAKDPNGTLQQTCSQVKHIRHAAVHRLPLTANTLQIQLQAAVRLASILKDEQRTVILTQIADGLVQRKDELENEKTLIENTFDRDMEAISNQRRELDEAERYVLRSAQERDANRTAEVGKDLHATAQHILSEMNRASHSLNSDRDIEKYESGTALSWLSFRRWRDMLGTLGVRIL